MRNARKESKMILQYEEILEESINILKRTRRIRGRRQRIIELLRSLKNCSYKDDSKLRYDLWVGTWILPPLFELIPELRSVQSELDSKLKIINGLK